MTSLQWYFADGSFRCSSLSENVWISKIFRVNMFIGVCNCRQVLIGSSNGLAPNRLQILTHWGRVTHICVDKSLVQIMACRLIGAKPLSEPMLDYCQLDPCEHISMKILSKYNNFHWWKCTWKCRLRNGVHLVPASICWPEPKCLERRHRPVMRKLLHNNIYDICSIILKYIILKYSS